jgi:hypothetical protein
MVLVVAALGGLAGFGIWQRRKNRVLLCAVKAAVFRYGQAPQALNFRQTVLDRPMRLILNASSANDLDPCPYPVISGSTVRPIGRNQES